jgi:hypothetical protein
MANDATKTDECECLPGQVCTPCVGRGYQNGLAGYAQRIYPDRVTEADVEEQERADREREAEPTVELEV